MILKIDNLALLDIWVKFVLYGWVYVLAERVRFLNWWQNHVGLYGAIFAVRFCRINEKLNKKKCM